MNTKTAADLAAIETAHAAATGCWVGLDWTTDEEREVEKAKAEETRLHLALVEAEETRGREFNELLELHRAAKFVLDVAASALDALRRRAAASALDAENLAGDALDAALAALEG